MTEAEKSFEKERIHFASERENMKIMYEKALQSKEETRLAAMKQLEVMNHLIEKSIGGHEENTTQPEHQDETKNHTETQDQVSEESSSQLRNVRGPRNLPE